MTPKDLGKFEPQRRYATTAAVVLESTATVIDELVDLHDRIWSTVQRREAQASAAVPEAGQGDQRQGAPVLRDRQALLEAKESGSDPYAAIEAVIPRDEFTESVSEAELLARPEGFDHLHWSARTSPPCAVTRRPCWRCWNCAPRRPRKACWQPCRPCVR